MIVCPLCEHQQVQGSVCEVCGRELVAHAPVQVGSEVLPELETNSLPGGNPEVAVERLTDLDQGRASAVQVTADQMPDMETTRFAVPEAAGAQPLADLERTAFAGDGQRTPVSQVLRCRYCGHMQQSGLLCDGCGMRLSSFISEKKKAASGEPEPINCPACSVKGLPGTRCRSCGAYIPAPEVAK